jgi:hypothetical protein
MKPADAERVQKASTPQNVPTIAEDSIIPIVYGGPERVTGMPYIVCMGYNGWTLVACYILCEGEVSLIDSIELNDAAPPTGCTFRIYYGTQTQAVDDILSGSIPGFAEAMPGTAYIVAMFQPGALKAFPKLTARVVGLKIPDPRTGNIDGWDNPALILAHFMQTYAHRTVNTQSVKDAADWCDVLVGGQRRTYLTITLAEAQDVENWIEVLRGYLPAWVVQKDGEWYIVPDQPSAPVLDYNADTDAYVDGAQPMVLTKRGVRDVPNMVEVQYTDTTVKPWTTKKALAQLPNLGVGERRRTSLSMPGIRSYAQAMRFAVERLNHYTLENIEGEISVFDDGVQIVPGDIITITDSALGWSAQPVRVLRTQERDNGRWQVQFRIYDAGAYATGVPATPPATSGSTLPNPRNVAGITGLTAAETLKFENASITNDGLARGLIWQSRIEATWDASPDSFFDLYEIQLKGAVLQQPTISTSRLPQFSSGVLIQGTSYTISVRMINTLGFASDWVSTTVQVLGKQTPPSDVTTLDFAAEIAGEVILRWKPVPEPDVVRYEWRALATSATTAPWDTMSAIDRPDTNYTRIKGIAPGATLFAIKAIDSVGRYSVNPLYVNLTITSDASAFLQNFDFTPQVGTSTEIVQQNFALVEGGTRPLPRWISKGDTVWNAAMPNPVASQNTPVVNAWGRTAAFILRTDQFDLGLVLETTINLNLSWVMATRGTPKVYVLNSVDGSTWDNTTIINLAQGVNPGWKAVKVTCRYIKLEIWSNANTDAIMVEGKINAQVASTSRKESGTGTTLASGPYRVNLAQKYTKAVSITITPKGTTFASPSYDNVLVGLGVTPNSFDVYIFNSSGAQIARDFAWTFAGV